MEKYFKHLELIQGIINRLAGNSFQVKGLSIVLVSALFALASAQSNQQFVFFWRWFQCSCFGGWMATSFGRDGCIGSSMTTCGSDRKSRLILI